jgi:hypothetical protein
MRTRSTMPRDMAKAVGARFATTVLASAAVVRACAPTSATALAARLMRVRSSVPLRFVGATVLVI